MATVRCNIVTFALLSIIAVTVAKEFVPVLLVQSSDSLSNEVGIPALSKWSAGDFTKYIQKVVNRIQDKSSPPTLIVFAEESLSVEDFSWASEEDYGSFPRLFNVSKASDSVFFPSISKPLKALESLKEAGFKWVKYPASYVAKVIASRNEASLYAQVGKNTKGVILVVDMEDANGNEDRPSMLRRHDSFIVDTYEKMKNDGEVLLIYTADHSSWYETEDEETSSYSSDYEDDDRREVRSTNRRLLAVSDTDGGNNSYVIYTPGKGILLYADSYPILYTEDNPNGVQLVGAKVVSQDSRATFVRMDINYKLEGVVLRVKFEEKRGYWSLTSIEYEQNNTKVTLIPESVTVEAPRGFSYHCTQGVTFKNGSYQLKFPGMQVQAYIPSEKPLVFGDGYDCVYFFTAAIWSGLFVTMLLALIMTWGLSMIMDIRTMDRFDDPKGKTITIANAE